MKIKVKMKRLVQVCFMFLTLISTSTCDTGVFFKEVTTLQLTYDQWEILIEANPFTHDTIASDLQNKARWLFCDFRAILHMQWNNSKPLDLASIYHINNTNKLLEKRVANLDSLKKNIEQMIPLKKVRRSRSLIPFMGNVLSTLFGTATEKDIKHLKRKLSNIQQNEVDVIVSVEKTIALVNMTFDKATQNTKLLKELRTYIKKFSEISNLRHEELWQEIDNINRLFWLQKFSDAFDQVLLVYDEVISDMKSWLHDLERLLNNELPLTLLPSEKLIRLLVIIENSLPAGLQLPFAINNELIKYYQRCEVKTTYMNNKLYVSIIIPLKRQNNMFKLYSIQSFGLPLSDNKLLKVELKNFYVGISLNNDSIIRPTSADLTSCHGFETTFCNANLPVYKINKIDTCESALILKNTKSVKQYCDTQSEELPYPQAVQIKAQTWIVLSPVQWVAHISCFNDRHFQKSFYIGLEKFHLNSSCELQSQYLHIPATFHQQTIQHLEEDFSYTHIVIPNFTLETLHWENNKHFGQIYIDNFTQVKENDGAFKEMLYNLETQTTILKDKSIKIKDQLQYTYSRSFLYNTFTSVGLMILVFFVFVVYKKKFHTCLTFEKERSKRHTKHDVLLVTQNSHEGIPFKTMQQQINHLYALVQAKDHPPRVTITCMTEEAIQPKFNEKNTSVMDIFMPNDISISSKTSLKIKLELKIDIPTIAYGKFIINEKFTETNELNLLNETLHRDETDNVHIFVQNNTKVPYIIKRGDTLVQLVLLQKYTQESVLFYGNHSMNPSGEILIT